MKSRAIAALVDGLVDNTSRRLAPIAVALRLLMPALLPSAAFGQCGEGGPCCMPNSSTGCGERACCELVCGLDPFCCDVEWDEICAEDALAACSDACAGVSPCCYASGKGCDDSECAAAVCSIDPFCCEFAWDWTCAGEAGILCDPCVPDAPPPACGEGQSCCVAQPRAGCQDSSCCALVCAADPYCCDTAWDGACAVKAIDLCPAACSVELTCGNASNTCCVAGPSPGCADASCCAGVCAADPFCCVNAWDESCAAAAMVLCPAECGGPACPADFDGNGVVGGADLAFLLGAWGSPGADLNSDGTTSGADLAGLLGAWGACEP